MVLDKSMEDINADGTTAPAMTSGPVGSFCSGLKPSQNHKPSIEILCNNQASLWNLLNIFCYIAPTYFLLIIIFSCIFLFQYNWRKY